jgi:rhodanese-related sulfurtransferase
MENISQKKIQQQNIVDELNKKKNSCKNITYINIALCWIYCWRNTKLNKFNTKNILTGTILIAMLLSTFVIAQPALANPLPSSESITVQQAEHMIKTNKNIVILDVRNETEYAVAHLDNAIWIPLHELENRIDELSDKQSSLVLVYCGVGGRSVTACQILKDHGFTKVYNMMGGITEWMNANYPVNTSLHYVNVKSVTPNGNNAKIDTIQPWLQHQPEIACEPCMQNQTSAEGIPTNIEFTVLEQNETHTITFLEYELDGTIIQSFATTTILWIDSKLEGTTNKTAIFSSIEEIKEDTITQLFSLDYVIKGPTYNMTVSTTLVPCDADYYHMATTRVEYIPDGGTSRASLEYVTFDDVPMTLSQSYKAIGSVADQLGKEYKKSSDQTLKQFADRYQTIATEMSSFSDLVKNNLSQYDKEVESSAALIADANEMDCVSCAFYIVVNVSLFDPICGLCVFSLGVAVATVAAILLAIGLCGACVLGLAQTVLSCLNCAIYMGWR